MMQRAFIVSDGTGRTAEYALQAAITQFPENDLEYVRRPAVSSNKEILNIVKEILDKGGFIIHTLVDNSIRAFLIHQCRINNIESIDIMGPLLSRLSSLLSATPSGHPGLFNHLDDEYFRRVETMNFALKHDDGLNAEKIYKAEIVLIGVSRTFKTPVSVYLSFKRWLVANVPIVLNHPLPQELYEISPEKVFCFMTNAHRLAQLRSVRHERLHEGSGNYADLNYVKQELLYARRLINKQPKWTVINVTNKTIEEISSQIIAIMKARELLEETLE